MKNTKKKTGLKSLSLYNIAFSVENLERSIKWYGAIFGFKVENRTTFAIPEGTAEVAIIEAAGMRLELLEVPNSRRNEELFADAPQHLQLIGNKSIVMQVENLARASAELEEKGVTFVWREVYLSGNTMLSTMIKDIDGNKINLFQTNTLVQPQKKAKQPNIGKIIQLHLEIWNEKNSDLRIKSMGAFYDKDVKLTEPFFKAKGTKELNTFIDNLLRIYNGYKLCCDGEITSIHDTIKFRWCFGPENDPKRVTGTYVIILKKKRVSTVILFVDENKNEQHKKE